MPNSNRPIDKSEEVMKGLGKEPARINVMVDIPLAALRSVKSFCGWIKEKLKGGSNR